MHGTGCGCGTLPHRVIVLVALMENKLVRHELIRVHQYLYQPWLNYGLAKERKEQPQQPSIASIKVCALMPLLANS